MNAAQLAQKAVDLWKRADAEGRSLTSDERYQCEQLLERAEEAKEVETKLKTLGHDLGGIDNVVSMDPNGTWGHSGDPGTRFITSKEYKSIKDPATRGQAWSSGLIDVGDPGMLMKGTLLEGSQASPGTGGGLVPVPQVVPGVVATLFQPLSLESLLLAGQAATSVVRYAIEGTATSAAAGVAEAGTKPESTLAFSTRDEPVKKIATTLSISDELLEDAPAVQTFINGRLTTFVQNEVERQLFRGTSGGNEVQGILTSRSVPVHSVAGTTAGGRAEILFNAMNGMRGSAFVEPEWIVLHPTDYAAIRLSKDTAGQYFGGGPFQGPYGAGSNAQASGQVTGATDSLWGKSVYVTSNIGGASTALVGSRAAAQVWSRGGLQVEATNSHSTYFVSNLTAIRAERRLALTLYRANGMVEVRFT